MNVDHEPIELAGCVITNIDGDILLIYPRTSGRTQWELPGGRVRAGETPEEAAKREAEEKLGVGVEIVGDELGSQRYTQKGKLYNYRWFGARISADSLNLQEGYTISDYFVPRSIGSIALSPDMKQLHQKLNDGEVILKNYLSKA